MDDLAEKLNRNLIAEVFSAIKEWKQNNPDKDLPLCFELWQTVAIENYFLMMRLKDEIKK